MLREGVAQCMLLWAAVTVGQEQRWWFNSYFNEDLTLLCNDTDLIVESFNYVIWEAPDGTLISTSSLEKYVVGDLGTVINIELTIKNVQPDDKGVYLCHVYTDATRNQKRGRLLRGVNIGGPLYRDHFEEYRDNLMVGGIAALALFVPLVTLCLLYKFRYQTREARAAKREAKLRAMARHHQLENGFRQEQGTELPIENGGEINPVYENYDEKSTRL